jgi:ketosteroid isomerase-like protein
MSENLDLVRSIYADWEQGDFSSAYWAHPDIEFASPMGVETGSWTGRAEMADAWRSTLGAYDELRVRADELRELDDERLLAFHSLSGRGKTSRIQLEQAQRQGAILFHIRDARVTRLVTYPDRERALADLGLAE